jgi:hypothetical protein
LEKTGVVDQLTRVLVSLYEENDKPNNAVEYTYDYFLGLSREISMHLMKLILTISKMTI